MPNAFSIFQSTQPCFLGSRVVWSIWFLCLWRAISFFGSKVVLFTFLLCWFFHCGGCETVGHTVILTSFLLYRAALFWLVFFFGKLFYFDWLLVLKITLWSYLLKKKKKTLWSYDLWTQRDNFHVIHNCHCHKWLADKESELG